MILNWDQTIGSNGGYAIDQSYLYTSGGGGGLSLNCSGGGRCLPDYPVGSLFEIFGTTGFCGQLTSYNPCIFRNVYPVSYSYTPGVSMYWEYKLTIFQDVRIIISNPRAY